MAEGLLKKYLKDAGKGGIEVKSAGIMALDGFPPTDETVKVMKPEASRKESVEIFLVGLNRRAPTPVLPAQ